MFFRNISINFISNAFWKHRTFFEITPCARDLRHQPSIKLIQHIDWMPCLRGAIVSVLEIYEEAGGKKGNGQGLEAYGGPENNYGDPERVGQRGPLRQT